jgi:hypothetical protein
MSRSCVLVNLQISMPFTQIEGCMRVIDEIYNANTSAKNKAGIEILVIFEALTIFIPPRKISIHNSNILCQSHIPDK